MESPDLITFDIFGTVINWYDGLKASFKQRQMKLNREMFNNIINLQGALEQSGFQKYTDITTESLVKVAGMLPDDARTIARNIGVWPLFEDSREGLEKLLGMAECMAMSNCDIAQADQVQRQLGFKLSRWYAAEELRVYKPNPAFWRKVSEREGVPFSRRWWHVSAYGDYDLGVAKALGLTCVFVERKHNRPGFSHLQVKDLKELAVRVAAAKRA